MEYQLPPAQIEAVLPGGDPDAALVHVEQFPEVVGLAGEGIAAGVFEVVHGVELFHAQGALQIYGGV